MAKHHVRPVWKGHRLIGQFTGALLRALAVAFLVAIPSLFIGDTGHADTHFVVLLSLLAGAFVATEYLSSYPSLIAFRDAPPYNRLRFMAIALCVVILTLAFRHTVHPGTLSGIMQSIAMIFSNVTDLPYSPVRLAVLMLPLDVSDALVASVRLAAGVCYTLSILLVAIFAFLVFGLHWPARQGAFNLWINLPMFDATLGEDIVSRLRIHARVNLILGFLLPFLIPGVVLLIADSVNFSALETPQTLIWMICAWAFIPASMIIRGIAVLRISAMIEQKRRSNFGNAQGLQVI